MMFVSPCVMLSTDLPAIPRKPSRLHHLNHRSQCNCNYFHNFYLLCRTDKRRKCTSAKLLEAVYAYNVCCKTCLGVLDVSQNLRSGVRGKERPGLIGLPS